MHRATAIEIDGAHGEGGGSIIRTALCVAALTGQAVSIHNARGGLRKPGTNSVDLAISYILAQATKADVVAKLGGDVLHFAPKQRIAPVRERIDVTRIGKGSQSGSAVIVLQSLLTPLARAGAMSRVECRGGTHVPFSPTYEYFRLVTLRAMEKIGIYAVSSIESAGYNSRSAGEIMLEIEPSALNGFDFTRRGSEIGLHAVIVTSELQETVGLRGVARCNELSRKDGLNIRTEFVKLRSSTPGAAVTFAAECEKGFGGAQSLGERGKPIEEVVEEAYYAFVHWLNGEQGTDEFLADQILLPAVFSGSPCAYTTSRITSTLLTTAWVIKQMMPARITILGEEGEPGEVRISP
ncbi:MAG TPA: RNA 3'-terminal phosphate cyclase [Fimbriimonadales bacterium]|nr:RNA 3'-terminal phosphate cyclase [Fimbriimonadales bacterium]